MLESLKKVRLSNSMANFWEAHFVYWNGENFEVAKKSQVRNERRPRSANEELQAIRTIISRIGD